MKSVVLDNFLQKGKVHFQQNLDDKMTEVAGYTFCLFLSFFFLQFVFFKGAGGGGGFGEW